MEVLLVNPPSRYLDDPCALPPLGLLYLGAALEQNGHQPKVVDLNLLGSSICGYNPSLIGVTCVTANYATIRYLIGSIKVKYPGVPVVVGGPHISSIPIDGIVLGADVVCVGDGEYVICRSVESMSQDDIVPVLQVPVDVNTFPMPARHLVPIDRYTHSLNGLRMTSMITQRGCPYECAFCCHYDGYRKVRFRNVENVVEEVCSIKAMGFEAVAFHDDELNLFNSRLLTLCSALEGLGMSFKANVRADLFTTSQAEAMSRAGFKLLCVGVESGSADILRAIGKGTTPGINSRARKLCKDAGIKFKAFVIVGLPGESRETVEETKRWLIDNEVDDLTVTLFIPYPGTPVHNSPKDYDIGFRLNYKQYDMPYRGSRDFHLPCVTWTSHLHSEELSEIPVRLEVEVRRELKI